MVRIHRGTEKKEHYKKKAPETCMNTHEENIKVWEKNHLKRLEAILPGGHMGLGECLFPPARLENFIIHGSEGAYLRGEE